MDDIKEIFQNILGANFKIEVNSQYGHPCLDITVHPDCQIGDGNGWIRIIMEGVDYMVVDFDGHGVNRGEMVFRGRLVGLLYSTVKELADTKW